MLYTQYNREERNICAHLFRVLHEPKNEFQILRAFLNHEGPLTKFEIFTEVALIRDAYFYRKDKNIMEFMDDFVQLIIEQEGAKSCRLFSKLPEILNSINKTHPRQILRKAKALNIHLNNEEKRVYGSLQAMFNAKPDLAIFLEGKMVVCEAKFTLDFDQQQLKRTKAIVEIWSKLLYQDLGYESSPEYQIWKLGLEKFNPDIAWENIIAKISEVLPKDDKSYLAMFAAVSANQAINATQGLSGLTLTSSSE